jgi:hypothetical protein
VASATTARQDLSGHNGHGAGLLIRRIQGVGSGEKEARIDSEKIEPELTGNPVHSAHAERDHDYENGQQQLADVSFTYIGSPFSSSPLRSTPDIKGVAAADKT